MLNLEILEGREVPAVVFNFNYQDGADSFFSPEMKNVIALAGRVIGDKLNPDPAVHGSIIDVNIYVGNTDGAIARAAPQIQYSFDENFMLIYGTSDRDGFIIFNPTVSYYSGISGVGIGPTQVDLFSITSHEILHILGIGTETGWEQGSVGRGKLISKDGVHFSDNEMAVGSATYRTGTRLNITNTDLAALGDLGWNPTYQNSLGFGILSIVGDDYLVRQYYVYQGLFIPTGYVGRYHIIVADYNYDGVYDVQVAAPILGYAFAIDGRTGGLIDQPGLSFTGQYIYQQY